MSSASGNRFLRYLRRLGAGSLAISIIVHVIVIILATLYVISTVKEQRKANFQGGSGGPSAGASEVQHRVQMSRQQQTLTNQRLAVDSPNASISLPDLPDMPGLTGSGAKLSSSGTGFGGGSGVGAGTGSGPAMPTFGFRVAQSGGSLRGYLYDFKQSPQKHPNSTLNQIGPRNLAIKEVTAFIKSGCQEDSLRPFLRSPDPLYATQIFVPFMSADEAPKAYGVAKYVQPKAWMAHYRGRVSPPKDGSFRFVGCGDDIMVVRINGRVVLDCGGSMASDFKTDRPASPAYAYDHKDNVWNVQTRGGFVVGHQMKMSTTQFYDIDVTFSEGPGGRFCAMLLVEEEGASYEKDRGGRPILPLFRVADTPAGPRSTTAPATLPDGPVWRALPPR